MSKQLSIQYINKPDEDEDLYDSVDLDYFATNRRNQRNHKLFTFRDWENLILKMYDEKCVTLPLAELQTYDDIHKSIVFKREIEIFTIWMIILIEKNVGL